MNKNECPPFRADPKELLQDQQREVDFSLYNSELLSLRLVGVQSPDKLRMIYFKDYENLNDKTIVGITVVDDSSISLIYIQNVQYTVLSRALASRMTLSIFDQRKKSYAIDNMPLASLISPATVTNMKYPYFPLDIVANMKKSFLQLNQTIALGTSYVALINVYYQ